MQDHGSMYAARASCVDCTKCWPSVSRLFGNSLSRLCGASIRLSDRRERKEGSAVRTAHVLCHMCAMTLAGADTLVSGIAPLPLRFLSAPSALWFTQTARIMPPLPVISK